MCDELTPPHRGGDTTNEVIGSDYNQLNISI